MITSFGSRAVGLLLGQLLDLLLGDPRRHHPVAWLGRLALGLERVVYRPQRWRGVVYTGVLVGGVVGVGGVVEWLTRRHPAAHALATALATWTVLGGTSLVREGRAMSALIERAPDTADGLGLGPARARLGHLCSRDATHLGRDELARATVESVAENTSDAVVAPLWWGAVAGVPGLLGYRAVNTLDAMVGYRSERYREFGWASARLDDLANLVPARVCALVTVLCAPLVGGSARAAVDAWDRDAPHHPSPNAGPVEATFAGALGVRLGGTNHYDGVDEDRGTLGSGRPVEVADVARATRLSRAVGIVSGLAAAGAVVLGAGAERGGVVRIGAVAS